MKRLAIMLCVVASVVCANAKILRVSNVNGSTAPYSSVTAALEAANDGDVIMVDASPDSYGDIEINKKVTLLGPGYWLIENGIHQEGFKTAEFGTINITAAGAKVSSVLAYSINPKADGCVVTRCKSGTIGIASGVKGAIIHQNIVGGIGGGTEPRPTNIQITNNIIEYETQNIRALVDSEIKYNTFKYSLWFWFLTGCVIENNLGVNETDKNNSIVNNMDKDWYVSGKYVARIDTDYKKFDAIFSTNHGAFAGEDPYVISGIAPGPYIEDITVPVSVEQGNDMKVTLKIGKSR